jgi:hypothetical protein
MKRVVAAAALLLLSFACSKKAEPPQVAAAQPAPAPVQQQTAPLIDPSKLPPGHPAIAAPAPQPAAAPGTLTGKVAETMDAGGYTYIKLRTESGDVWTAVQQTKVKVGGTITIAPQMTLDHFESKTLKRTFDHIIFGVAAGLQQQPIASSAAQHMSAPAAVAAVSVAKAEGTKGRSIAEVWAQKDILKDAPVAVRGKVVKFLPGIMGKNWLHLRDGSGSHESGDDDITVTTNDMAAVGDVVLVSGTVRLDKDFGAGYRYPVIVEEAKVSK